MVLCIASVGPIVLSLSVFIIRVAKRWGGGRCKTHLRSAGVDVETLLESACWEGGNESITVKKLLKFCSPQKCRCRDFPGKDLCSQDPYEFTESPLLCL